MGCGVMGLLGLWGCGVIGVYGYGVKGLWGYGAIGVMGLWGRGLQRPNKSPFPLPPRFAELPPPLEQLPAQLLRDGTVTGTGSEPPTPPPPPTPGFPPSTVFGRLIFPPIPMAHVQLPVGPTSGSSDFRPHPFRCAPRGSPPHFRSSPPSSRPSSLPIGFPSPSPRVIGSLPDTAAFDWPSGAEKAPRGSGAAILRRSGERSGGAVVEWGLMGGWGGGFLRFLAGPAFRARFWMGGGRAALGPVRRLR